MFPAPVARGQPRRPRSGSGWSPTKSVCIEHQHPPRLPSAIEWRHFRDENKKLFASQAGLVFAERLFFLLSLLIYFQSCLEIA